MEARSSVTLRRLAAFAAVLARFRPLILAAAIVAGVWLVVEIALLRGGSARSLLALSALLWVGVALGVGYTLPVVPPAVAIGDALGLRLRKRLAQLGYVLALAIAVALILLAAGLTARAIGLGVGGM